MGFKWGFEWDLNGVLNWTFKRFVPVLKVYQYFLLIFFISSGDVVCLMALVGSLVLA